jgi:hypothetical protein
LIFGNQSKNFHWSGYWGEGEGKWLMVIKSVLQDKISSAEKYLSKTKI